MQSRGSNFVLKPSHAWVERFTTTDEPRSDGLGFSGDRILKAYETTLNKINNPSERIEPLPSNYLLFNFATGFVYGDDGNNSSNEFRDYKLVNWVAQRVALGVVKVTGKMMLALERRNELVQIWFRFSCGSRGRTFQQAAEKPPTNAGKPLAQHAFQWNNVVIY